MQFVGTDLNIHKLRSHIFVPYRIHIMFSNPEGRNNRNSNSTEIERTYWCAYTCILTYLM